MKKIKLYTSLAALSCLSLLSSCSDFTDVNTDPKAANVEQVQVEYILNSSIYEAQMNPHIAERVFVLYWKTAGRQQRASGIATGSYNDGWSSDYYDFLSGWLKSANLAITVGQQQLDLNVGKAYTNNLIQVARIWRVYLMSEFSDNFGPMPLNAFQGVNPNFSSGKDVYIFLLNELKDAVSKIDVAVQNPESLAAYDKAYGFDYNKWIKYGNSMRMRLAMRMSQADPALAKSEFEAAASQPVIIDDNETFQVAEKEGWNPLTGVMSREWNAQLLSATLNNLYINLGGVKSTNLLPDSLHKYIKPADWMGVKYDKQYTTLTNDPSAGFFFDGLHDAMDPRAYQAFIIPGDFSNPNFSKYPSYSETDWKLTKRDLLSPDGGDKISLECAYTWNATAVGEWGDKGSLNQVYTWGGSNPRLSAIFRKSSNKRIFFAPWETYFLFAEAAVRGWTVPVGAQEAYEKGIEASFRYWGVSQYLGEYLASTDYNRCGTSVSWTHTTEPTATLNKQYKDGYSGTTGTYEFTYPNNTIYKNGTVKNDALNKIMTQKFIAQTPWLPLETWSDHRRLGLPFFENPAVEKPLLNMPALSPQNCKTNQWNFFPQRLKYPSSLQNSSADGYKEAVGFLGAGGDEVLTPLWWAAKGE